MTAVCAGGGASQPKPGWDTVIFLASGELANVLNNAKIGWLSFLAPLAGLVSYELPSFCAADPPSMPSSWTLADTQAILKPTDFIPYSAAVSKLDQIIGNVAWYQFCQCVAGAAPVAPAPPPMPSGQPTSATFSTPATGGICLDTLNSPYDKVQAPGTLVSGGIGLTWFLTNNGQVTYNNGSPTVIFPASFQFTITITPAGNGPHPAINLQVNWSNQVSPGGGPLLHSDPFTVPADGKQHIYQFPYWSGANRVDLVEPVIQSSSDTVGWEAILLCPGNTSGGMASACCPPDPMVMSTLQALGSKLDLLQRQLAPFAYIPGLAHAGLTGHGQLAVSGILGLSVSCTTLPSIIGAEIGTPPELFGVGWLTTGTADGWQRSYRIDHNPYLLLPIDPPTTLIGYTLSPGVVATITELKREA